jgi:hypothetical protein
MAMLELPAMNGLTLTLLGGFEVRLANGTPVDLPGQKDRALSPPWPWPPAAPIRASALRECCGASMATARPATA